MAAIDYYIGDPIKLQLSFSDPDGVAITDLTIFEDIVIWLQNKDGATVLKEYSLGESTVTLVDTNSKAQIVIEAADIQGARLTDIEMYIRPVLEDTDFEDDETWRTVSYDLFNTLKHAKSYE